MLLCRKIGAISFLRCKLFRKGFLKKLLYDMEKINAFCVQFDHLFFFWMVTIVLPLFFPALVRHICYINKNFLFVYTKETRRGSSDKLMFNR